MLRSTRYSEEPTGRTIEPVEVRHVRTQCHIEHTEDDEELGEMLVEARRECETVRLGDRALIDGACVDYFNEFADEMELHWGPVDSITKVEYVDSDGDTQTLSTSVYTLGYRNGMGVLRLAYDQSWPTLQGYDYDEVFVTYKAGYGASRDDVPVGIRRWIKARAAWIWQCRDGETIEWGGLDSLLSPFATDRVVA